MNSLDSFFLAAKKNIKVIDEAEYLSPLSNVQIMKSIRILSYNKELVDTTRRSSIAFAFFTATAVAILLTLQPYNSFNQMYQEMCITTIQSPYTNLILETL